MGQSRSLLENSPDASVAALARPMRGGGGPFRVRDGGFFVRGHIGLVEYQGAELASIDTSRVDAGRVWVDFKAAASIMAKDQMLRPTP